MNHCPGSGGLCQATAIAEGGPASQWISTHAAVPGCGQVVSTVHALGKFITAAIVTCRPSMGVNATVVRMRALTELWTIMCGLDLLLTVYPSSTDTLWVAVVWLVKIEIGIKLFAKKLNQNQSKFNNDSCHITNNKNNSNKATTTIIIYSQRSLSLYLKQWCCCTAVCQLFVVGHSLALPDVVFIVSTNLLFLIWNHSQWWNVCHKFSGTLCSGSHDAKCWICRPYYSEAWS